MIMMYKEPKDILDDEIRIISGGEGQSDPHDDRKLRLTRWGWVAAVGAIVVLALAFILTSRSDADEEELAEEQITEAEERAAVDDSAVEPAPPFTEMADTTLGQRRLTILTPRNAAPRLIIGDSILDAAETVLAVQAADVRHDNQQIVGAYVIGGDMKSKGKSKSGFCAIINGDITIGVAQATPLLEQATEEGGYFFRQYPLVYEGEIIENNLKNKSQRKALAEWNGRVMVVVSQERLSLHDFSQALVDLGVKNAIYLTGSTAYLKARLADGRTYEFGKRETAAHPNTNYIYWQ